MLNYTYYANLLNLIGQQEEAFRLYQKSYRICIELYGKKSRELSLILYSIGKYYYHKADFDKALKSFQFALISGIPDFSDSTTSLNPELKQIVTDNHIHYVLNNKANTLFALYENTDEESYLANSIETYDLALRVSENIINAYTSESSQLEFLHSVRNTWNSLFSAMSKMPASQEKNEKLLYYAEQSKASLLLGALKDMEAKSFGNIPVELVEETENIKKELSYYEKQAYEESLKPKPDQSKMKLINNGLFTLKTRYDSLVASFEEEYPAYYRLKYDDKIISVKEVQEALNDDQVLIEYALADSLLLTFTITNEDYNIHVSDIDSSFYKNIENFREILKVEGTVNFDSTDYYKYVSSAYNLYKILLEPSEQIINQKELIVIPDGEIGYLSFDMLLTKLPESKGVSYRKLPYALKQTIFSYNSSATIHFSDFGENKKTPSKKLLAFAPEYSIVNSNNAMNDQFRNARETLLPIPGVEEEVKNILKIYSGKMLLNEGATETNFKDLSEQYNILHLAMHTIIDDINPLYSFMVFSEDKTDTINDGFLNTYELFNMSFSGELAVLSACNTGTGKLERGEGIMSLARGFIYSGIPSIVMTLWTVEDQPSADLITAFYKNLSDGMPKAVAMNKAKIDYLNKAGELKSHPYFWAGYVNIGDVSPLSVSARNIFIEFWWVIPIIVFITLVIIIIRRRRSV
jgi:CHAT domain-containing protein